jgi:flagellar basal-body rod protein FlgB
MTTQNIGLFKALTAKMDFLDQRQKVLSRNVANSDTPNFKPKDLLPVDFGRVLVEATGDPRVRPVSTHASHIPSYNEVEDPKNRGQRQVYEVAPAGNAVILEEQLLKAGENQMDYNLMTTLYQKHVGMMRIALGTGR